jgi:hypothetical protein
MASTTTNTPDANAITQAAEGTTIWSSATLRYWFATSADAAAFTGDDGAAGVYGGTATFNPLEAANAGEALLQNAFLSAYAAYARVADLPALAAATSLADADIAIGGVDNFSLLGQMNFPGENTKGGSATDFQTFMFLNTTSAIAQTAGETGGGSFALFLPLHELGHGLGLGHPHDGGGGSATLGSVTSAPNDATEDPLDNERYTVMSYELGGLNQQTLRNFGHAVTPMAIDIAALQNMYGTRASHTGDTTYTLTDAAAAALDVDGSDGQVTIGRAFYAIWDTGGEDEIVYAGANRALINLNNATLSRTDTATTEEWIDLLKDTRQFDPLPNELKNDIGDPDYHAGGFFSRIFDAGGTVQLGGFSIANENGVATARIENATGGSGNDLLIGNVLANELRGAAGGDVVIGAEGADTLDGGAGDDTLGGGRGDDSLAGGAGADAAIFVDGCSDYEIVKDDATGVVTIRHVDGAATGGTDTLTGIEKAIFSDGEVDLTVPNAEIACPPIDFIFLVDLSGSYADDLPNFQAAAPGIAASVLAVDPDARFAVASFVDLPIFPYGSAGDYVYRPELALTEDVGAFEAALGGLTIRSGGDFPESQWAGLWGAANGLGLGLRDNSRKIILIATDAPAHSAADYGLSEDEIAQFLEDNAIDTIAGFEEVGGVGDTDPEFVGDPLEPLLAAVGAAFAGSFAVPIFAVTSGNEGFYEQTAGFVGGVVAPLNSSGSNIGDAVSVALADLVGDVTGVGGSGNDSLRGTPAADGLFGLDGNDSIDGLEGDDLLDGGSGNDSVFGAGGIDTLRGGSGDDTLLGGDGNDLLEPGLGLALVDPGPGRDTVAGASNELDGITVTSFEIGDAILLRFATAADVTLTPIPGGTALGIDTNGDGLADATLNLGSVVTADQLEITTAGGDTTIRRIDPTVEPPPPPPPQPTSDLDIYRFYNVLTKTHFYTSSAEERDFVLRSFPQFQDEGNRYDASSDPAAGVSVFRFYNTVTQAHFYTASAEERDFVQSTFPQFQFEGIAYHAWATDGGGEFNALYRFYNIETQVHFYTNSAAEKAFVEASFPQFKYENVAYYVDDPL